uniref:Uncharacterized protein n=1 Tax=Anguilla anguilla TaxID=7936 RepID=A0A0E9REJ6_ANGAN
MSVKCKSAKRHTVQLN